MLGFTQITSDGRFKSGNLVTDGARLYFVEWLPGGKAIVQVPASGGEAQVLSTFFKNPEIEDLSSSRAEMLVADPVAAPGQRPALWALPLSGGQARRVGNIFAEAAAWSADGNSIAYALAPELYVCKSDGTGSRKIASVGGIIQDIRWSADNSRLRFTLIRTGTALARIWQVQPDGSDLHALFPDWGDSAATSGGSWTPDGKYFLFTHSSSKTSDQIWVTAEEPGAWGLRRAGPAQLTAGPDEARMIVPGANGRKVFFAGFQGRNQFLRLDNTSKTFVPHLAGVSGAGADFSPDGQWVVLTDLQGQLWRRRADGGQPLQLTFSPRSVELPRWSPDGKSIAFMARKDPGGVFQVFLISADGGECHTVLPGSYPQGAPTWSSDGTRLAFGEILTEGARADTASIHVVNVITHEATTIPGSAGLWTARWSPDGQRLAALTADSRSLMVFEFHRSQWQKVVTAGNISDLNWSRDSGVIYFEERLPPQGPAIFRVRLRDRRVEHIASLNREPPIYSPWFCLMPDGSPLVSNLSARTEIYALDWRHP